MAFNLEKRVELDNETLISALTIFETPKEFYDQARLMVTNEELVLIAKMGMRVCSMDELKKIAADNNLADDVEGFIDSAWRRVIINKVEGGETGEIHYEVANFYSRFPIFAQYEPDVFGTIPKPA